MRLRASVSLSITLLLLAAEGYAIQRGYRDTPTQKRQLFSMPSDSSESNRRIVPMNDVSASGVSWVRYETQTDLPDPFTGSFGHMIAVGVAPNNVVTQDNFAVGFDMCCRAPKYEQKWTFTVYAPDASNNPTVVFQQAFAHQTTETNAVGFPVPCWDGSFCGATSVDYFPWWQLDCTWKRGNYKSTIEYQFRLSASATLSTPVILFERDWVLGPSKDAISISVDKNPIHPSFTDDPFGTGYAAPNDTIPAATTTIHVRSLDCGIPVPNVQFTLRAETDDGGSGHVHAGSACPKPGTNPPIPQPADPGIPIDLVASIGGGTTNQDGSVTVTGTTNSSGEWTTSLTTGRVSANLKMTATTTGIFLGVVNFTSRVYTLKVGFIGLVQKSFTAAEATYLYLTGETDPHPSNHWGSPELNDYVRILGAKYFVRWPQNQRGQLGIGVDPFSWTPEDIGRSPRWKEQGRDTRRSFESRWCGWFERVERRSR